MEAMSSVRHGAPASPLSVGRRLLATRVQPARARARGYHHLFLEWCDRRGIALPAWATPVAIASLAMLVIQSLDHRFALGNGFWSLIIVGSLVLLFSSLYRALARPDRRLLPVRACQGTVLLLALLAGNTVLHAGMAIPHLTQTNRYATDAAAATDCATQLWLHGKNPYHNVHMLTCMDSHGLGYYQTTPLRAGTFWNIYTYPGPNSPHWWLSLQYKAYNRELDRERAAERSHTAYRSREFESRFNYPGASILFGAVAWTLGSRDLVILYLGCAVLASLWIFRRAEPGVRAVTGVLLLADTPLLLDELGGTTDILYGMLLVFFWYFRERALLAGLILGVAAATRQQVWFFLPFFLYLGYKTGGWQDLRRRGAVTAAVFLACNAPFVWMGPGDWLLGVLGPMRDPMFAQGVGLISISIVLYAAKLLPLWPPLIYGLLELAVWLAAFRIYTRRWLTAPGLAMLLPLLPLTVAWRSLHNYFLLLPLLATAVLACPGFRAEEGERRGVPTEAPVPLAA